MPLAAARKIEFFARGPDPAAEIGEDIQLIPVVLTHDQCVEYRLPRTPIKDGERRAGGFEARFGEGATELDALESLHPGELRRILVGHIKRYYDIYLDNHVDAEASDAEDDLNRLARDVEDQYAEDLAALEKERASLADQGRKELAAAWKLIIDRERDFETKARPILEAMNGALAEDVPDAGSFDWPEPAEGEEHDDPLFDSTRTYLDQIERYHQHQGKTTEVELWQDRKITCVCARCGKDFPASASRKQAKVCSPACRTALKRARRKVRHAELDTGGHPGAPDAAGGAA
jgi:hypothetical protein